ncbi:hypothetical protein Lser_V15G19899 [Lactuca serriola]
MAALKFPDMQNLAMILADPPVAHQDFKSMIHGLRECCLASAITMNTAVYHKIIREFWQIAKMTRDENGAVTVHAIVQGCMIVIDETFVRETLLINDLPTFPTEIGISDAQKILRRMGYEGDTPPTIKKLLPPYRRFLAHVFVSCSSGRRSDADEISLRNSGAIVSLAAGIDFNFSRFILD